MNTKPLYLIAIALFANAAILTWSHFSTRTPDILLDRSAFAQSGGVLPNQPLMGARGLYMMPAQLGPTAYGVYLMDVDSGTITVYRANPESSRLRLMAARSFRNDRFLEDYNNDPPSPKDVQKFVNDQRQRQDLEKRSTEPTVNQTPKPDENTPDTAPGK